ncbi:MAG: hypothetical protein ACOYLB_04855 [Phototrophicaceae bacterium]
MKKFLSMLLLPLVMGACAADISTVLPTVASLPTERPMVIATPTAQLNAEDALGGESAGVFSLTASGAVNVSFAGAGLITCEADKLRLSSGVVDGKEVFFLLPSQIAVGEYVVSADDPSITSTFETGLTFDREVFGILTLDLVPMGEQRAMSGSFDMNYSGTEGTVNVIGEFDFTAQGDCP